MFAPGPDDTVRRVATASGMRLSLRDTAAIASSRASALRPLEHARSRNLAAKFDRNWVHSVDWRWLTDKFERGPGESWLRPMVDVVNGEPISPIERVFAVADAANGVGSKLDITRWTFLNTDLAVHLHRMPVGEWIGIRAETNYGPDGVGATVGTLFDQDGAIGATQQSVLVRRRSQP